MAIYILKGCKSVSWRTAGANQKGSRNQGLTTLAGKGSKEGFGEKTLVRETRESPKMPRKGNNRASRGNRPIKLGVIRKNPGTRKPWEAHKGLYNYPGGCRPIGPP